MWWQCTDCEAEQHTPMREAITKPTGNGQARPSHLRIVGSMVGSNCKYQLGGDYRIGVSGDARQHRNCSRPCLTNLPEELIIKIANNLLRLPHVLIKLSMLARPLRILATRALPTL